MLDGVITVGTAGLGAAWRMARFGTLSGIKNVPIIPLPRFMSRTSKEAVERAQTQVWNELGGFKQQAIPLATWGLPAKVAKDAQADWPKLNRIMLPLQPYFS